MGSAELELTPEKERVGADADSYVVLSWSAGRPWRW